MKAALISDTHGLLPSIPDEADFVLHAGDIGADMRPLEWFHDFYRPWALRVRRPIFATFGNHDRIGERHDLRQFLDSMPGTRFLVDELLEIGGVPVWFSPWSNRFFDWAWMLPEDGLARRYAAIPEHTQVIVTHGPPKGYGDDNEHKLRCGSESLTARMDDLPALSLVVTGHIHEARGEYVTDRGVRVINCACLDSHYQPVNHAAVVVEWPPVAARARQMREGA